MNNQILVQHYMKKKIAKEAGCSFPTVRSALAGMTDTDKAMEIRKIALEKFGGVEVKK